MDKNHTLDFDRKSDQSMDKNHTLDFDRKSRSRVQIKIIF